MLSVIEKIYSEILVDGVRRVTEGLIGNEQGGFKAGRRCVDQIFTLKEIDMIGSTGNHYGRCCECMN